MSPSSRPTPNADGAASLLAASEDSAGASELAGSEAASELASLVAASLVAASLVAASLAGAAAEDSTGAAELAGSAAALDELSPSSSPHAASSPIDRHSRARAAKYAASWCSSTFPQTFAVPGASNVDDAPSQVKRNRFLLGAGFR